MKQIVSLILALALCLSLCACGGGNDAPQATDTPAETPPLELKDYVLGTWERNFTTSDGQEIKQVIEVYKGGTGKFYIFTDKDYESGYFQSSWEIQDDVLNFTYGGSISVTLGLILDTESQPMTLTQVDDNTAIFVKTE